MPNSCDANNVLRIGYVLRGFRQHAVAYFIEPVLAITDKSQVEVFCYSNSLKHDAFTERLIAESDHWQACFGMTDDQLAQRIRDDGIDILVDLSGHTAHNRLLALLASRRRFKSPISAIPAVVDCQRWTIG